MSPPVVGNATVTSDVSARTMTIICNKGYLISTGVHQGLVTATISCNADGTWNATGPCTRTRLRFTRRSDKFLQIKRTGLHFCCNE